MKLSYRNPRNAQIIAEYYSKPLDKPDWYKVSAESDEEADILLYDYIGWPYNDAGEFVRAISELTQKKIIVRINSPGGDVWDASAIHNAIRAHPSKPITRIESLAASAASYIAVAGFQKQAYKNTMMMIHEPWVFSFGNQFELRELADLLEQISGTMIEMYADNTNVGKRELREMLKSETWMNAKKMKEKGFIDTILEAGKPAKAQFDLSVFANIPEDIFGSRENFNNNLSVRDAEKALRDVGFSKNTAKAMLAGSKQASSDQQEIETLKAAVSDFEIKAALQKTVSCFRR